ncbi:MAG: pyruvate, phosphate dikinase [Candidatus Aenigmatarchaeota archaeon]
MDKFNFEHEQIYFFGDGPHDKELLGGKGANLGKMRSIGLPVPPGFTITTEICTYFTENERYPSSFMDKVNSNVKRIEDELNKGFGSSQDPLLVSVRSGAAISMPGMMDTVLNLGLNDKSVEGLANQTDNKRFAYDSYRRLIQMFGDVVLGMKHSKFEDIIEDVKEEVGAEDDTDLSTSDLKELVSRFKDLIKREKRMEFPQDPQRQLKMAIDAVFESWDNERAIKYREANDIPHDMGTAVNVQAMVFGNIGDDSGTGVGFTRDPSTGKNELYGEYLLNAQGEDVVAGIRTPHPIEDLKEQIPSAYNRLEEISDILEEEYKDMQDFEFTIQEGKLWMLQTRTGKRTADAAVKIAVDMKKEGIIDKETSVKRVDPEDLSQLLHKRIDPEAEKKVIGKGLNASPGAAAGQIVFDSDEAEYMKEEENANVILVRPETSPEDIHGLVSSQGIVTSRGGMTSHAAVVARGMGKPCVAGCDDADIDLRNEKVYFQGNEYGKGDYITMDGGTGEVIEGKVEMEDPKLSGEFETLLEWAEEYRELGVRTNADTPEDAMKAREFGAEGIGLCRTEHMFMSEDRMPIMREMIMAEDKREREDALEKLLPMQKNDFVGLFKAMEGNPVTIRLLDPPLHEFLPDKEELLEKMVGLTLQGRNPEKERKMLEKVRNMEEANPMLGLRGCRLGISNPEIFEMQVRAIVRAAIEVMKDGLEVKPQIMIPLVSLREELDFTEENARKVVEEELDKDSMNLDYKIGTMIELPRACVTADEIAEKAEFFSFGTNDLTQTTFGFSRDDAEAKFFSAYEENGIMEKDPFQTLDKDGVGKLVDIAVRKARTKRPEISIGICGEHGGDPESIKFCKEVGLDYVSCSPYRVPIARLAAAQVELEE